MRIKLVNCEETIMCEIGNEKSSRDDVAITYAMAICSSEAAGLGWGRVNDAIVARWSMAGLVFIKQQAWKLIEEKQAQTR